MIWAIIVLLFIFWVIGFSIHLGGALIHILLVLVVIGIIYNLFFANRGRAI
jgi:hypothetical protein